jgi:Terminase small subunit
MAIKHSFEEVQAHPLYQELTPKQQKFLALYIETGNREEAAKGAYDTKNPDEFGRRILRTLKIRKLLTFYRGESKTDDGPLAKSELIGIIASKIRQSGKTPQDNGFVKLVELYMELAFNRRKTLPTEDEPDVPNTPSIQDLVQQIEKQNKTK